ncbi:MAG TPA: EVE domain-containing protein [Polyangia bacterium]|jgi:predicted RNA-binding protein with PUA-like domain|nr:EVE domain-containing protein [Polyangia bacterium]
MPAYWLIKSEPFKYSWQQLVADGQTHWDGVRNFEARNNLRAMKAGDLALFYHSNEGKEVVGVARVVRTAYQDPTTEEDWSVVDVAPVVPLVRAVGLAEIKGTPELAEMQLLRRSRLSVVPVTEDEFKTVLKMGKTKLPAGQRRGKGSG